MAKAEHRRAESRRQESGRPGGGEGRRDEVGGSGVYPMSGAAGNVPERAELRTPAAEGQGERGAANCQDAGGSEPSPRGGQLLGGLSTGPDGRPTTDTHGGVRPAQGQEPDAERRDESGVNEGEWSLGTYGAGGLGGECMGTRRERAPRPDRKRD